MKDESRKLMSIEDIPYVVDHMEMIKTLLWNIADNYFYDLRQKAMFSHNFNHIKANIEAIRALHMEALDTLCAIAENTEGVELDD